MGADPGPAGRTFLGVDGGGTKTGYCLISGAGEVLALSRGPSISPLPGGPQAVAAALAEGVAAVCETARRRPREITRAFFGIPAYGEVSGMTADLDAAPRQALGHGRYACGNDMVCGWAGSLAAGDGINVISGTGSMTYGERRGRTVRVGGWGELFGDEGSGYWIAIRGLNAFSRMSDGRLPRGPLVPHLVDHLGLEAELDLVDVVLNRCNGDRAAIAALAPVVAGAARAGDTVAAGIFADAAEELAELVHATWRRLGGEAAEVTPVSYSGGVFASGLLTERLGQALDRRAGTYRLQAPRLPPLAGAAIYAARLNGTPLDGAALGRLESSLARDRV